MIQMDKKKLLGSMALSVVFAFFLYLCAFTISFIVLMDWDFVMMAFDIRSGPIIRMMILLSAVLTVMFYRLR
jgi:hypothetical protein